MNRPFTTLPILLAAMLSTPALAGKKKDKAAETPAITVEQPMNVPADGKSQKFAQALIATQITEFKPSDSGGADFVYQRLTFKSDNSWEASAYVEVADERMECKESGTWTMEPAETDKTATVSWELKSTDCPGRSAGETIRVEMTLENGKIAGLRYR